MSTVKVATTTESGSMLAWQATAYGLPGRALDLRSVPRPEPGPGELRIRVEAASLNPALLVGDRDLDVEDRGVRLDRPAVAAGANLDVVERNGSKEVAHAAVAPVGGVVVEGGAVAGAAAGRAAVVGL